MIYQIEIVNKKGFPDQHGKHLLHSIKESGFKGVNKVAYSSLYQIEGHLSLREIDSIARHLLSDPVTETYTVCNPQNPRHSEAAGAQEVEVWPRHGVTDTTADSVVKAVQDMNINKSIKVKTGQKYVIESSLSKAAVEQVVKRLLANPMIQEFKFIR